MKRAIPVLLGLVFAAVFSAHAFAASDPNAATTGWIQVCKNSAAAPNAVVGNFRFRITDAAGSTFVSVAVGSCSAPQPVVAGAVTVRELGSDTAMHANGTIGGTPDGSTDFTQFFSSTASGTGVSGATGTYNAATMTFSVTVPAQSAPNNQSRVVT